MTVAHRPTRYSIEDYLQLERYSNVKHEFYDGQIFAMGGGTPDHAAWAARVSASLITQLRGRRCRVYSSDVRVRICATGLDTYPDVSVVCGEEQRDSEDQNALINPTVIVEVLSPRTETYDRGDKFEHYKLIPTLQEVVFVCHDRRGVEVWRRAGDSWTHHVSDTAVELPSIGCVLEVTEVFTNPLIDPDGSV